MSGLGPGLNAAAPHQESSSESQSWPRKRPKFYAVRKGRNVGVYSTWEEYERQTKGYPSEFKRFDSCEEAQNYIMGRHLNFMTFRRATKPDSSLVGGGGAARTNRRLARWARRCDPHRVWVGYHVGC
jgi:viroplasmin and RNaseH domain-containing protein